MAVAKALGFDGITLNSLDGVSDRDFCVELLSAYAILMMHISRFSEEIILWASWEFKFVELSDVSTGSSIMPQKKNPDMAELARGKTGRVYGDLMAMLTVLKGLPLAYNKDMQEDKEAIFDAIDTVKQCLAVFAPMIDTMTVLTANMRRAASNGFINATDCADYLVKKGLPFRSAYKITGTIVAECIARHTTLEDLPLEAYKAHSDLFDSDLYPEISLEACVEKRISEGGTGAQSVQTCKSSSSNPSLRAVTADAPLRARTPTLQRLGALRVWTLAHTEIIAIQPDPSRPAAVRLPLR